MERVSLGRIVRPHGVRGEVRVHLYNPDSTLLEAIEEVWLEDRAVALEGARPGPGGAWLVRLAGIDDRDAAEALRGVELAVPREVFPEEAEDTYLVDLLGLKVVDGEGRELGTVEGVEVAGPQDLLVVRRGESAWLLPAVEPLLGEVDTEAGTLTVNLPEGLSDLENG